MKNMSAIQHYFAAAEVGERARRKIGGYDMEVGDGKTTIRLPNYFATDDDCNHIVSVGKERKCQAIVVWESNGTRVTFIE
jgi:hypothetical protein